MHAFSRQSFGNKALIRPAFTLVEILAATGIMVVVILVVMGLTTNVLTSWNRASGELSSNFEGRIALELLAQDLESIVLKDDGNVWMDVRYHTVEGVDNQAHIMFFSSVLNRPLWREDGTGKYEKILGDVCAVQYVTDFKNPFGTVNVVELFGLYRAVVDAENTFNIALDPPNPPPDGDFYDDLSDFWAASGGFSSKAINESGAEIPVGNFQAWATGASNYLSSNVVDFRLVFYYRDIVDGRVKALTNDGKPDGRPLSFIYLNEVLNVNGDRIIVYGDDDDNRIGKLQYVDVSLTVLSEKGGSLLHSVIKNIDTGEDLDREQVIIEHGSTYSRRIYFLSEQF